jgi:hypothetical protein
VDLAFADFQVYAVIGNHAGEGLANFFQAEKFGHELLLIKEIGDQAG